MPGGCKSILNVKFLHKSYIMELFGPRVFCFSVGQNFKKILKKKKGEAIKDEVHSSPPRFFEL